MRSSPFGSAGAAHTAGHETWLAPDACAPRGGLRHGAPPHTSGHASGRRRPRPDEPGSRAPGVDLFAEALDHVALGRLLDQGGYVTGSEREFYGRSPVFSHVIARVLRFRRPAGASAYLVWAQRHAADTVGALRSKRRLLIGETGVVVAPKGCGCHGETPTFLAIWRHGDLALWLLASGPGVNDRRVDALAGRLDDLGAN